MLLQTTRGARILAACAALSAMTPGCGDDPPPPGDARVVQRSTPFALYWVGASLAGMPLTGIARDDGRVTFLYGTCHARSDQGCSPPLEIQSTSICDVDVLRFATPPRSSRRTRGIIVRDRGDGDLRLASATTTVSVFARGPLAWRAVGALRPVAAPARAGRQRLPRERLPREYVDELRDVRDAYLRLGSIRAVRDELAISQRAVRLRLALARELGGRRLRRPAAQFAGRPCAVEPAP